jgi:pyridoxal 5-phosphate dependent beta-lyase
VGVADSSWRWWRERRVPAQRVHLDTAAAGRSSVATLAATAAYAEREAAIGAYVAAAEAAPVLAAGRAELARLLPHVDCTPEELGLLREALLALGHRNR